MDADISPVVEFMVRFGLAGRLLAEHVDDGFGHCRGCAWPQAPRPVFPCSIHVYAARASAVERRRDPVMSIAWPTGATWLRHPHRRGGSTASKRAR